MTNNELLSLIKHPEAVEAMHAGDLKELVELYPYFSPARLFHAKSLQKSGSVLFGANLKFSSVYATNRRWLYYYIYPDKKINTEYVKKEKPAKSGDYFDMMNNVASEGGDTRQSLRNLADRLKSARALVESPSKRLRSPKSNVLPDERLQISTAKLDEILSRSEDPEEVSPSEIQKRPAASEELVKKMIKERNYQEAIEILNELNLINPKKSVYFADQIRFLEKVIANTKK